MVHSISLTSLRLKQLTLDYPSMWRTFQMFINFGVVEIIEVTNKPRLDNQWKLGGTVWKFHLSMELRNGCSRSHRTGLNLKTIGIVCEPLNSRPMTRHPVVYKSNFHSTHDYLPISLVGNCLTFNTVELQWSRFLTRTPETHPPKRVTSKHMVFKIFATETWKTGRNE